MNDPRIGGAGRAGRIRRLAVTIGATIGLIVMSSAAIAENAGPTGTVTGFVFDTFKKIKVVAIAADGTRYEGNVRRNGHYRITDLPPGTYELEFSYGETVWFDGVVVEGAKEVVLNTSDPAAK